MSHMPRTVSLMEDKNFVFGAHHSQVFILVQGIINSQGLSAHKVGHYLESTIYALELSTSSVFTVPSVAE